MLRIGVLSTAAIGVRKVIPGIAKSERCRVTAIASRSPEPAQAASSAPIAAIPAKPEPAPAPTPVPPVDGDRVVKLDTFRKK